MDTAVDARAHVSRWHDEKLSSPNPKLCDEENEDILLDTYFDHSQPLDNSALNALFETNFDDDDSYTSTKAIAAKWRPAHTVANSQPQHFSPTEMGPVDYHNSAAPVESLPSSHTHHTSQPRIYGLPVNAVSAYHELHTGVHPPSPYDHQAMAHQTHRMSPSGVPTHFSNGQYFATPSPVSINDLYRDPASQVQHSEHRLPDDASCHHHSTNDLMNYENIIPEEDEAGGNIDPCYAQLLYKCLEEAPDHTMTLKNVYEWVRQHSKKARESSGTGWQNSVRHNLSMNAVST